MQSNDERIIIGIDPGSMVMGYGILLERGKQIEMVAMGVIKTGKSSSPYERLRAIYDGVMSLIRRYQPHELAIEAPFYGKNIQSMLTLGRAQGVAIAAALSVNLSVNEYAPMVVKRAITGRGSASKEQVAGMLQRIFHIPAKHMSSELDATDGLAVAYCHVLQSRSPLASVGKGASSWEEYLRQHPDKVSKRR